jgi:hypothetical protein
MKTMAALLALVAIAASQPHHWLLMAGYALATLAKLLSG